MTVTLWVNWDEKEILTTRQLDNKIDNTVSDILQNPDSYLEELDEYLDNYYTKIELFEALTDDRINKEKFVNEIREGIKEQVRYWNDDNIRRDYQKVEIEI